MTLLLSWLGVDSRGPSSIYLMSDSRISWPAKNVRFDFGKKVFACKHSPDIFGYCGDVLFPSIVLSQIVELIDQGLLFESNWTCEQKSDAFLRKLKQSFANYPSETEGIIEGSMQVIHCSRDNQSNFYGRKMRWMKNRNNWTIDPVEFKDHSDRLYVVGSGAPDFLRKFKEYEESVNQKTSRALFHCFIDTLSNGTDPYVGGGAQLAGLYRIKDAQNFGIIYDKKRYFQGIQVDDLQNFTNIEWRNELFERCDGNTMQIMHKAKRKPNPLNV